jgi:hypothetical protein
LGQVGVLPHEWALHNEVWLRLTEAGERLIRFYEVTGQPEEARAWREKLPEAKSKK